MGSWRFSCAIYYLPIMKEITEPVHPRDGFMIARESIFFKLLSFCANGNTFDNAEHFSRCAVLPKKQCEIVWDVCLKSNVLQKVGNGYSTIDWMRDVGLMPKPENKKTPQNDLKDWQNVTGYGYTPKDEKTQTKPVSCKEIGTLNGAGKKTKLTIRPNVFLTEDEYNELKSKFSDEHLSMMLDKLNDYKLNHGTHYRSDMDAINRWVIKWLNQTILAQDVDKNRVNRFYEKHGATEEVQGSTFPAWLTGKD